jgi:hypothetical protein
MLHLVGCNLELYYDARTYEYQKWLYYTKKMVLLVTWQYMKLYVQLYAPDDGRMNCLKHVEHFQK